MVGILIVAHSNELAEGVCAVASQVTAGKKLPIAAAGGLEDGSLGTSLYRIQQALDTVYSDDGVLVLMDLGSAVMTTQMLLEMLSPEQQSHIRLSSAPLVEGAIAAAVMASQGGDLNQVQQAAETAMEFPKIPQEILLEPSEPEPSKTKPDVFTPPKGPVFTEDLVVPNPVGLHARPAALFVQTASQFSARITVQNITQNRQSVDAKSMMQVASQGTARQGETIRIVTHGEDAGEAMAALRILVEEGFGEMGKQPSIIPKQLQGLGVSEGFVVAPVFVYRRTIPKVERFVVENIQAEIERFRNAINVASQEVNQVKQQISTSVDEETGRIFDFHLLMLQDGELIKAIEDKISGENFNAEVAVSSVFDEWVYRFEGLDSPLMRARAVDVKDVKNRLLYVLTGVRELDLSSLPDSVILVADDLVPSETATIDIIKVRGFATSSGGATSHTAIIARMLGIPAVVGLGEDILNISNGTMLALDGKKGQLEIDPSPEMINTYREQQKTLIEIQEKALEYASEPAVTRDGKRIEVVANIGDVPSAQEAILYGAEGVGLLRTEFLFLGRTTLPDEEEQFKAYSDIVRVIGQRPLIVRTLDVGGDKQLPYLDIGPELNPFLGVRAIRLCLEKPGIFQTQLRAILRVSVGHNVKVMFPMVATRDEIIQAKEAINQAKLDLSMANIPYADLIEVGIMIETPAAAIKADILAPEVDFFSIGSNDLTQYTLAVDRGNKRVDYLYNPLDPSVLKLIHLVVKAGHSASKWVGVCGEMAGQYNAIPILLGLGVDELSMTPRDIPVTKQLIRLLEFKQAKTLSEKVLTLRSAKEVEDHVNKFLNKF